MEQITKLSNRVVKTILDFDEQLIKMKLNAYLQKIQVSELSISLKHPQLDIQFVTLDLSKTIINELSNLTSSFTDFEINEMILIVSQDIMHHFKSLPDSMRKSFILLDILLLLSEADPSYTNQNTLFYTIEYLLDLSTVNDAEGVIDYIEERLDRLTVNFVSGKGKALIMLRFCNELMRRLSRVKHIVFCGRILILLANVFPLSERSAVNLKGEFNVSNITTYDEDVYIEDPNQTSESKLLASKDKLYSSIWGSQKFLSQPTLLFDAANFNIFKEQVDFIKQSFDKITMSDFPSFHKPENPIRNSHFFPKYLTGKELFELELKDHNFRKQIIIQILFIIHFLFSLTKSEQEKNTKNLLDDPLLNRTVSYTHVLSNEQESWVVESRSKLLTSLEKINSNGRQCTKAVLNILIHEKNWIAWKQKSCQKFDKPSTDIEQLGPFENIDFFHSIFFDREQNLKSRPLIESFNLNLDTVESLNKSLDEIMKDFNGQIDENGQVEIGIEDQYLLSKNDEFNWLAYRTARTHHISLLQLIENGVDTTSLLLKRRNEMNEPLNKVDQSEMILQNMDISVENLGESESIQQGVDHMQIN